MGGFSLWHWLVVGIIILLLFGKGRFSDMMGDVAKGLKSFKKGLAEDEQHGQARLEGDRTVDGRVDPVRTADPVRPAEPAERREP
jgi:sec-independent protein translocase protein TatA